MNSGLSNQQVFLVVEPMAIIAEDLSECILECHPDAVVLRAAHAGAALAQLAAHPRVTAAFVHLDHREFCGSAVGQALLTRGAKVIFMGSRADQAPDGSILRLRGPFDTDTVTMLLQAISECARMCQAAGEQPAT